jgi:hypothetical protein
MWKFEHSSNDTLVEKAWDDNTGEYIHSWWMERDNITDLRYIIRDGQKILQAKYMVHVSFNSERENEAKRMWLDVPLEEE